MTEPLTTLDIDGLDFDGDGLADLDGRSVRVPLTIPGERVEASVRRERGRELEGRLVRIVRSSPFRVAPRCPHFGPCGGCAWQHIAYPEQLRLKRALVQSLLDHALGPGSPDVAAPLPTPVQAGADAPWAFRSKVSFVFGAGPRGSSAVMGHYRRGSRQVVAVRECPVHAAAGNEAAFAVRAALDRARLPGCSPDADDGIARHVVVRVAVETGERLVTLVVTENVKPLRGVTDDVRRALLPSPGQEGPIAPASGRVGFHLNVHDRPGPYLFGRETRRLFGENEIRERVAGVTYVIGPTAFFQTNVAAAEVMVRLVMDAIPADRYRRVFDLYSGVGLFALPMAARGQTITAVEENREALTSAAAAIRLNRIDDRACRLMSGRVESVLARLTSTPCDAVVLDPPRQGCPPRVLDAVVSGCRPETIVYVSCNPEALATDLAAIPGRLYRIERVQPVDMFPHTAHVETVAVLRRVGRGA
jgi:23S rRNA (uracil1939-C5)-methyltransferase